MSDKSAVEERVEAVLAAADLREAPQMGSPLVMLEEGARPGTTSYDHARWRGRARALLKEPRP
jgi:hypothetical protein